ncbi:MoxR family ATPase [Bariatricus massiliensis]|uniref:MoxR family ATPase n=1 Tax=Bariatricus massiliensis TaxID=1745713 RepID=A0ABS8DEX0_9FIRM|nr:MoxR family ATPase [Bariatricus massiliensis]MCB7303076.1 MoxR family ATPase [Bariatricus massiliensis]MCB7374292.1 MoxR family ATPase [Bariatricus massiliensis]MCB7386962.1 MoxR family ATPase [Bariatricus massiliensis]MCB7411124.1 MoxR family ATPase [Bariatricus massiliensis]MCQ5251950.1 MoxR family ATPase [Bariatricus massiliensis]
MDGLYKSAKSAVREVQKAVVGKEDAIEKIMMAIAAKGHILIEDMPGVGKTTMALAFSKAMGIKEHRVQFTPDVMPADLTGFSIYQKETGRFVYQPGALICNLFMADEINRTSPKTQSALLEAMEEGTVTVDGVTRKTGTPFIVIATENPVGSAGTQLLPDSQLDRFMVCLRMGYPTVQEEVEILKRRKYGSPVVQVERVMTAEDILEMQEETASIYIHDLIYAYIAELAKSTREQELLDTGLSPRGTVALSAMARAKAWISGRNYVLPDDVKDVFLCTAAHRVHLSTKARVGHVLPEDVLTKVLQEVKAPAVREK